MTGNPRDIVQILLPITKGDRIIVADRTGHRYVVRAQSFHPFLGMELVPIDEEGNDLIETD